MIKIAPSILSADFANLERDIQRIAAADYVHVDVMDGVFVPNISIGIPVVKSIRPTTSLPLDVHLMITRPVRYVEQFCDAGADLVTVHVEADTEENIHAAIDKIHAKGKKAGVVLKPKTPAEAVLPYLTKVELILVMTVEPGFGGQKFMADMMPKVTALRKLIDEKNLIYKFECGEELSIAADSEFKIGDANWGSINFGMPQKEGENGELENYQFFPLEESLVLVYNNNQNILLKEEFYGVAYFNLAEKMLYMSNEADAENPFAAVNEITVDDNAPAAYYTIQGVRVSESANGLYIVV